MDPALPLTRRVRVLLADTHFTALWGLARLIRAEPHWLELADVVSTPADAVASAQRLRPHIVLLDCSLDAEESLGFIPQLQQLGGLRVIAIAASIDEALQRRARAAGAYGVLDKSASGEALLHAIARVHECGCWVDGDSGGLPPRGRAAAPQGPPA